MGLLGKDRKSNEKMNQQTNETNLLMNRETNQANLAINRANIDYSREAWKNEVAYNWEMFNAENEYNSASAQRQRLEEAGMNPYMMMSGGSAGTASGSSSPSHNQPQQIPMQAGHVEPYYRPLPTSAQDMSNLLSAVGQLVGLQKQRAETIGIQMQNDYYRARADAEIAQIIANTRGVNERTKGQMITNFINDSSKQAQILNRKLEPHMQQYVMNHLQSQTDLNQINRQLADARLPFIGEEAAARIRNINANTALTYAQKREQTARAIISEFDAEVRKHVPRGKIQKIADAYVSSFVDMPDNWNKVIRGINDVSGALGGFVDVFSPKNWFSPRRTYNSAHNFNYYEKKR